MTTKTKTRPTEAEAREALMGALDSPTLRVLLGEIEDSGTKEAERLWGVAMMWMDERDEALRIAREATQPPEVAK